MSVVVVDPPSDPVVSLEEAKVHLRVDHDDEDDYIESLVAVATAIIDGPSGWLGRCLINQTLEWRGPRFGPCDGRLPFPPVTTIQSVKYDDSAGAEQTVPDTNYRLVGRPSQPRIVLGYGMSWPSAQNHEEAVRILYDAGYGEPDDVPAPIRHAILMMVAELYENREAASDATRTELPFAVTALLSPFRVFA